VQKTGGRAFRLEGLDLATPMNVENYIGQFAGNELPPPTGAVVDLYNRSDVTIREVTCTGGDRFLQLDAVEATIDDVRVNNCGRAMLIKRAFVPVKINGPRVENVLVSGIDGECVDATQTSVEVGYKTRVGPSPLPADFTWAVAAGSGRVEVRGGDVTRWIPEWSVIRLAGLPIYVQEVDATGFTFYQSDPRYEHCALPAMNGTGASLIRLLGITHIMRGDGNSLCGWGPNLNDGATRDEPIHGLPVAAFYPLGFQRSEQRAMDLEHGRRNDLRSANHVQRGDGFGIRGRGAAGRIAGIHAGYGPGGEHHMGSARHRGGMAV
jgi:hypothetical protein